MSMKCTPQTNKMISLIQIHCNDDRNHCEKDKFCFISICFHLFELLILHSNSVATISPFILNENLHFRCRLICMYSGNWQSSY